MDDNNFATSEASHEDQHFATEVPDEVSAPEVETHEAVEAPEVEGSKLPRAPKTSREALEEAFDKAEGKTAVAEAPKAAQESTIPKEPPPLDIGEPKHLNAPASWDPAAREAWAALPDAVKETVAKREHEAASTLAKTTAERRLAYEFMNIAQPFAADLQSLGVQPLQAVQQFFQVDRGLRVGTPDQKAQIVSKLIKDYGVDLATLDNALAGIMPQQQAQPGYDPHMQARLEAVENFAYQQQQQAEQQQRNQINTEIDKFLADPKNEFFNDVYPQMVALMHNGVVTDLKSAYDQACYANPNVRQVLQQRDQANKARLAAGSASLPNKGPRNGPSSPQPKFKSTRDALEAAFEQADKQRRV